MNIQDILSVFNATHEFIDSVINPLVNDGNRTAFAASLQRMVSTPFHDNEPSANCNENQAVERRTDRTFAENSVRVLSTGHDCPSTPTGETFSGTLEASSQTRLPRKDAAFQVWGCRGCAEPLTEAGAEGEGVLGCRWRVCVTR